MSISQQFIIILFLKVCVTGVSSFDLKGILIDLKNKLRDFLHLPQLFEKAKPIREFIQKIKNFKQDIEKLKNYQQEIEKMKKYQQEMEKMKQKNMTTKKPDRTSDDFGAEVNSLKDTPMVNRLRGITSGVDSPVTAEKYMSAPQLIKYHGYEPETHTVQARDGYFLEIHRVVNLICNKDTEEKKKAVLLHHGLMGSSKDWLLLGPGKALPYLLSDLQYDVWITNARYNAYSQFHSTFADSNLFWDFSFHEMGYFDLPVTIDYITNHSENYTEINFIGYSMGGTALLVLLSTQPQYNSILKSAILLAPLAFMSDIEGPLKFLAKFYRKYGRDSLHFLGDDEFLARKSFPLPFIEKFCDITQKLCFNPLFFIANCGKIVAEEKNREVISKHNFKTVSSKTIKHYLQLVNSGTFRNYDYGTYENIKKYGAISPPAYDLSQITMPIAFFSSNDDCLCTTPNMLTLLQKLPNFLTHNIIENCYFSHTDFIWGVEATAVVFYPIIDMLKHSNVTKE